MTLVVTNKQVVARDYATHAEVSFILHAVLLYTQIFIKGINPPIFFPHTFLNFLSPLIFVAVSYKIRISFSFVKAQEAQIRQPMSPLQVNTLVTDGEETASAIPMQSALFANIKNLTSQLEG